MRREIDSAMRRHRQQEALRIRQQGQGKPIIGLQFEGHQFVAVGNSLHFSPNWKTFPDFLSNYLKSVLGAEWGNGELAKPLEDRHPILQWYNAYCAYQAGIPRSSKDEVVSGPLTGAVCCYLGLAYNLYLLKHNVELQERLLHRLKSDSEFPGAYYELIVANCLIRSGFELELEDELDDTSKHCEFAARSKQTGIRYWVEAKMRSVEGVLGKTADAGSKNRDPTSRLSAHLNAALRKPADGPRFVFIDLNAEPQIESGDPGWLGQAIRRLEGRERTGGLAGDCYVFVTNMAFHRALDAQVRITVLAYGLGMTDFGKPGPIRLRDWYLNKRKHIDAYNVVEAIRSYPQIPETFDGKPSSQQSNATGHFLRIGETYIFEGIGPNGSEVEATVTSVAVDESERTAIVAVWTRTDKAIILRRQLADEEFADYKKYGPAYFGDDREGKKSESIFDFYEWLVNCYARTPRDRLLELAVQARHPELERLRGLSRDDIALELCEGWVIGAQNQRERNGDS